MYTNNITNSKVKYEVEKRKKSLNINSIENFLIENKNIEAAFFQNIFEEDKFCKYLNYLMNNDIKKL